VPVRAAAGGFITSSFWNAQVDQGIGYSLAVPLFVGTQTITQSISNSSWTVIALDTEQSDSYAGHSTTSNSSRYTAQVPGWYQVCGVTAWGSNATGVRAARIHVNGSVVQGTSQMIVATSGSITGVKTPTRAIFLNTGDYVEVAGWQNSGGALSTGVAVELASSLAVAWSHT
jgi:hypothetical protein